MERPVVHESSFSSDDPADSGADASPPEAAKLNPPRVSTFTSKLNGSTDPLDSKFEESRATISVTSPKKYEFPLELSLVILFVIIALVWCLFIIPVVLYHVKHYESPEDTLQASASPSGVCEPYGSQDGDICTPILQQLQQCLLPESDSAVTMVSPQRGSQEMTSSSFQSFLQSLRLLGASQDCIAAATPFACQYLFPLCSSTSEPILPSAEECMHLSDGVCDEVWQRALQIPGVSEQLPNCNVLQSHSNVSSCEINLNSTSSAPSNIQCRDEFFIKNDTCIPRCDSWEQDPHSVAVALDIVELVGAVVSILGTIALVAVSCVRWRSMFTFPAVLMVYMTVSLSVLAVFIVLGFSARDELYCGGSRETSVLDTISTPTPFCTINGVALQYIMLNMALWWIFHVSIIFWSIMFPIHHRTYSRHKKLIHISLVIAGLLIPIPGTIAGLAKDGYGPNKFPPLLCSTKDSNIMYYSVLFPTNVIVVAGLTMIMTMLWKVYKLNASHSKQLKNSSSFHVSTAEKKLLFVFTYYTIFVLVVLIYFALFTGEQENLSNAAKVYFLCEAPGHNPESPCPQDYEQFSYPGLAGATFVLLELLPIVNLVYVVPWIEVHNFFKSHFTFCG